MNPNTPEFYDAYWGGDGCASYLRDKQLDEIAAQIVARVGKPPQTIMDIGGGISRIARLAKQAGHIPFVVDFSAAAVGRMAAEGISGMVYDVRRWRGKALNSFVDVTMCTEMLEHLDDPERAVRMARAHAPRAFFTVPNNCMGPAECPTHLRAFTETSLRELLSRHYRVIKIGTRYRWLIAECSA